MSAWLSVLAVLAVAWALAYWRASMLVWTAAVAAGLVAIGLSTELGRGFAAAMWAVFFLIAAVFNLAPLRRNLVAKPILRWFHKVLPQISPT